VPKQRIERVLERGLFASRWLMAPFYVGLVLALIALLVTFVKEILHVFSSISTMGASDVILASLSLIDLSLAGNLLLIVIFSGYESFVSKIDIADHEDQFEWKGKVDFAAMKLKLIASIVAISGIHLLKVFMDVDKYPDDQIRWMVIIHIIFVVSGVMLAVMDRIAYGAKKH
jgi:uncharacterized protein (TIGR00645 family)